MKKLQFSLLLILLSINTYSQSDSYYFSEDFIFLDKEFLIKAENLSDDSNEILILHDGLKTKFNLSNLNNTEVFNSKFANAVLKEILKLGSKNTKSKLISYFDELVSKTQSDRSYSINKIEELFIKEQIESLANCLSCSALYELKSISTVLNLSESIVTKDYLNAQIEDCVAKSNKKDTLYREAIKSVSSKLFPQIVKASQLNRNNASEAGKILVTKSLPVFDWDFKPEIKEQKFFKSKETSISNPEMIISTIYEDTITIRNKKRPLYYFDVDSVTLEIYQGLIYNIKAIGKLNGKPEIFENKAPIPFSTKNDVNFNGNRWRKHKLESVFYNWTNYIFLSDLIKYNYALLELTENYTPKNQIVTIYPNTSGTKLYKERNKEILEVKIFTDFIGLTDPNPNGLVQTEISKRLPFNTNVIRLGRSSFHTSFFNYINPHLELLKLEENNRKLKISKFKDSINFVNFLDIDLHRSLSIGLDLNFFNLGMPRYHSLLHINLKTDLGRVGFSEEMTLINPVDSMLIVSSNSITKSIAKISPEIIWHFNPSDKYQLQLSYRNHRLSFLDKSLNIRPINNEDELIDGTDNNSQTTTIHEFEFLSTLKTNETGKFFFRTRFNYLNENTYKNYFQVQFGYSYLFLARRE